MIRRPDGDFWLHVDSLPSLQLTPSADSIRQAEGETWHSLRALGATSLVFDEANLTLTVDFPAQVLEGTRLNLGTQPPPALWPTPQNSLILGYRLSLRPRLQSAYTETRLDTDLNVRLKGLLLRQEVRLDTAGQQRRAIRGVSQAIWDDLPDNRRILVGDTLSSAGVFGSTITGAGILLAKSNLNPDLITQPTVSLRASANMPSDVEVAVDGNTIYRAHVGPGPITLNNLLLFGGSRTVRVTVTDPSGRHEVIEQPFLFTDAVLAEGLHDYSYFLGKRSSLGIHDEIQYHEDVWQGFHRYGLSDYITIGAGGEGNRDFTTLGVGATVRSDRLGLFGAAALVNEDRQSSTRSQGWSGSYTYLLPGASLQLSRRQFDPGFRTFSTSALNPFIRSESHAAVATQLFSSAVALDFGRLSDALSTRTTRTLRTSTNLNPRVSLWTDLESRREAGQSSWSVYVSLRFALDSATWVSSTARASPDSRGFDLDAGRQIGLAEGFGYRVGVSADTQHDSGSSALSYAAVNWNLRPASLEFYGSSPLHGGGSYAEFAVTGSVLAVDGHVGFSRRVNDGFVLAKLGVPQPGIQVYLNSQDQGRTGEDGTLFLPDVGTYSRQEVSLDDKGLGMQFNIGEKRHTVTLPYRGGVVVDFGVRKLSAVTGMAWQRQAGTAVPIASRTWTMRGPDGPVQIETSRSGDFYLETATAGTYTGTLELGARSIACRMTVPPFPEAVHELKEGIVCD